MWEEEPPEGGRGEAQKWSGRKGRGCLLQGKRNEKEVAGKTVLLKKTCLHVMKHMKSRAVKCNIPSLYIYSNMTGRKEGIQ